MANLEIMNSSANSAPAGIEKLRQELEQLVLDHAKAMVQAMIDESSEKGNVPAMKYLFEMAGLFPADNVPEIAEGDSLAQTLLSRLGFSDEESERIAVTKEYAGKRGSDEDAVE